MQRPTLSVAVIALNEADRIQRLLASAAFADEIVVVDSGSTDGTPAICRAAGARVIQRDWSGYADQKQFALTAAGGDWVLNLDADEAVSPELAGQIQTALKTAPEPLAGFAMPRLSRYLGRWIRHGGWYPDRKIRLVRRNRARWIGDGLHEQLVVDGGTARLSGPILHYVYRDISDQLKTIDRFSGLAASRRGPAGGWVAAAGVGHALGKFIECYVWKLGLLDGLPGLVIAMNSAWYVFLRHAKRWELGIREKDRPGH